MLNKILLIIFCCILIFDISFALDQWAYGATSQGDYPKEGSGYAVGTNEPSAQGAWVDNAHWCKTEKTDLGHLFLSYDKRVTPTKIEIYFAGPALNYGYSEIWIKDIFTNKYTRIDQTATKTINGAVYTFTNLPNEPMDYLKIVGASGIWGCIDAVKVIGVETKANITGGTKTLNVNFIDSQYGGSISDSSILKEGNNYYMYMTGGDNIYVIQSKDFLHWGKATSLFVNNNMSNLGKINWSNGQSSPNKKYVNIWAPDVIKIGPGTYFLGFSASEKNNETVGETTIWSAYASSPFGPFGPTSYFGANALRMYEPLPLRNQGSTYNSNSIPHSDPYLSGCPYSSCSISARLDSEYFWDGTELWMGYTYFGDGEKSPYGNYNSIVHLDSKDPTLTNADGKYYRVVDSQAVIYDHKTGKRMHMCVASNKSPLDSGYSPGTCIVEGVELLKKNGKYYLFYSANFFDSRAYSTFYKMANSIACLEIGKESDPSCGVKQGILYDGIYGGTDYTYGHGGIFEGPSGELLFSATVMRKSYILAHNYWRKTWIVPLQFDSEGVPITMAPTDATTFNVTIPIENCSDGVDNDFDEIVDCSDPDCLNYMSCQVAPTCIASDWNYNLFPVLCPRNQQQVKKWSKIGNCTGGVSYTDSNISCNYLGNPICSQYPAETYSSFDIDLERINWINGNNALTELLRKIKIWKYC